MTATRAISIAEVHLGLNGSLLATLLLCLACAGLWSSTATAQDPNPVLVVAERKVDGQKFLDYLAVRLRCPLSDGSPTPPTTSCVQENREWLMQCVNKKNLKLSGHSSEIASIQMVDLVSRYGALCSEDQKCQRPPCEWVTNHSWSSLDSFLDFFQPIRILENIQRVVEMSNCRKYINLKTLQEEISSRGIADGQGPFAEIGLVKLSIAEHLLNGDCVARLSVSSSVSEDSGDNATHNTYLDVLFNTYTENCSEVSELGVHHLLEDVHLVTQETINSTTFDNGPKMAQPLGQRQKRRLWRSKRSRRSDHRLATDSSSTSVHMRLKRSIGGSVNDDINRCLKSEELIAYYDSNGSGGLDKGEFLQMLAYIVFQISSGTECMDDDHQDQATNMAEVYGYATLCVFVISACSTLGFLVLPLLPDSIYQTMMVGFIALAFGTLTGDAIMHMLPESLLEEDPNGPIAPPSFWKTFVITMSIYALFVFEVSTNLLLRKHSEGEDEGHGHGHSHVQSLDTVKKSKLQKNIDIDTEMSIVDEVNHLNSRNHLHVDDDESEENVREMIIAKDQVPVFLGLTSLALVIISGDMIHNVTDGISIGASFAKSISEGFSTGLAVFFHELPHEFGDFVILITTGQTLKQALFWNFISSLTAFVGVYVGIAIGVNEEANQWIFAVTAGMFLYVAIADMLPELRNVRVKRKWLGFLAANIGTLFGIGFMVFMYFLEDLIQF